MKKICLSLVVIFVFSLFITLYSPVTVNAGFNRSMLITDSLFTDVDSMSVSQIQSFLEQNNSVLANWTDNTNMYNKDTGCMVHKATGMTAAQIIHEASTNWGAQTINNCSGTDIDYWDDISGYTLDTISPKVILATLQKEVQLISTTGGYSTNPDSYTNPTWPSTAYKLSWAMGYSYGDEGDPDQNRKGFYNQVMSAAWGLRFWYERSAGNISWDDVGYYLYNGPFIEGRYRHCSYGAPDCWPANNTNGYLHDGYKTVNDGTEVVYLSNRATAALYRYTPHTGNEVFGGNKLFVSIYEGWFGPTNIEKNFKPTALNLVEKSQATGDFNNDGFDDLAIGSPGEGVGSKSNAGAVNIIFGSAGGLNSSQQQHFYQGSKGKLLGSAEANDRVGSSLTVGDFDNDGFDDLAIGSPGESVGSKYNAGGVNIIFGSNNGLNSDRQQHFYQGRGNLLGSDEPGDLVGFSLISGDFDGDSFDDLAIGSPGENIGNTSDAGAANIIYGSNSGLNKNKQDLIHQEYIENSNIGNIDDTAQEDDYFGYSLSAGDYDNDGFDDLVLGVPGEDAEFNFNSGAAHIVYGSASRLDTNQQTHLYQETLLLGSLEAEDYLGASLASGDINSDNYDDLVLGVPGEDIGSITDAGAVNIIHGSSSGLDSSNQDIFYQGSGGLNGGEEKTDYLGSSSAIKDIDNDNYDDLVIGVPGESIGSIGDAGATHVIFGSISGLNSSNQEFLYQGDGGLSGGAEKADYVGSSLAIGDFDGDNYFDISIGVSGENIGRIQDAGAINIMHGSVSGIDFSTKNILYQGVGGLLGSAEKRDLMSGGDNLRHLQ